MPIDHSVAALVGLRRPASRAHPGTTAAWLTLAIVSGLAGGRHGRRAGLRALLSMSLAQAVGPFTRPAIRNTTRAAAFAAGAALEAPWVGAPSGLLAVLLRPRGVRGVRPAAHLPGLLAGGAAALATTLVWPRSDDSPAIAPIVHARVSGDPSPTGAGLTVVVNEIAGPAAHRRQVETIVRELPDAEIVTVDDASELEDALDAAARRSKALAAVGGDGSIAAAANVAVKADVPLLIVPGGTLNHFARDLGLDCVDDSIEALRSGDMVELDVGRIDGRLFLNTTSFGTYSDFVDAREQFDNRIGKWPAVVVALGRTLWGSRPLTVRIDGVERRIWMIFIGNCAYDPPGFAPATRRHLADGKFDVRTVDGNQPLARLRLIVAVLTGRLGRSAVYRRVLVDRLDVATGGDETLLAADGEIFTGSGEFIVEKNKTRLRVFAPHR